MKKTDLKDLTPGYAAYAQRAAVSILYRAMKIETWVVFCRHIREHDEEFGDEVEPHISCWRKLAEFSDRVPEASEEDLYILLDLSEIRAFVRYVAESFENPDLFTAAAKWFEDSFDAVN